VLSELPKDFDVSVFYKGDSITISVPGTGQVYQVNPQTLSIQRLDRTFFRGYNFGASQFLHNDTLFSIGGEGFWSSSQHSYLLQYPHPRMGFIYSKRSKNEQPSSAALQRIFFQVQSNFFRLIYNPESARKQRNLCLFSRFQHAFG
jgi:hypothetical protein